MKRTIYFLLISLIFLSCDPQNGQETAFIDLKSEIDQELHENILNVWYPLCIDTVEGGYLSNFNAQFDPLDRQDKMIVTQTRHLWTTSMEAQKNSAYLTYAKHGFSFIQQLWDQEYGGFYQHVDRAGSPLDQADLKTAYGNAFAIYGLSAYYQVSKDSSALTLAKKAFQWLETHSHDSVYRGYFEHMYRDGSRFFRSDTIPNTSTLGYKDHNSSIHLLEAFTSLYEVWHDPLLKNRLAELFYIVKDTIVNEDHYMDLYFTESWEPISYKDKPREVILENAWVDHVSFGHDIETAFLLLEAAEVLGLKDEALIHETKAIVDQSLEGWDAQNGGLFDQGYYFGPDQLEIILDSKAWWAQAETLNTLLIFHTYFPEEGYDQFFKKQWNYIKTYVSDPTNGGWYLAGLDTYRVRKMD